MSSYYKHHKYFHVTTLDAVAHVTRFCRGQIGHPKLLDIFYITSYLEIMHVLIFCNLGGILILAVNGAAGTAINVITI